MPNKLRERKPDAAWFKSRLKSAGLQVKDAADAFGLPPNKVWQMLAARRRVQPEELATWARLLRVPMSTIFKRMDYPWESGAVPIAGIVGAGAEIVWADGVADGLQQFSAPYPEAGSGELRGVVLEVALGGYARGAVFYYEPYDRIDRAAFGRLAIVRRGEGRDSVLGAPGEIDEGRADVQPLGAEQARRLDKIISATPVKWIRTGL